MKYLVLILMVTLAGCTNGSNKSAGDLAYDYQDLRSYEDKKNGVTCYRVVGYDGLSCLKTKKSLKEEVEDAQLREILGIKEEK